MPVETPDPQQQGRQDIVYISGPMTGHPEFNYPAFNAAAQIGRARGLTILNPAENFEGEAGRAYHEYMRADLTSVLIATAIALLPGWETSKGARAELHVAQLVGIPVLSAETFEPMEVPIISTSPVSLSETAHPDTRDAEVWKLVRAWRSRYTVTPESIDKAVKELSADLLDGGGIPQRPSVEQHDLMLVLCALFDAARSNPQQEA